MMRVRGVRGATTVTENTETAILSATRTLLEKIIEANEIVEEDVASVIFTTTPELTAAFPAKAAREMGWRQVALLGAGEIGAAHGIPMCIRVLVHWNTERAQDEITHVYMRGAEILRPDFYPDHRIYLENGEDKA
jgi:chorismate mutase